MSPNPHEVSTASPCPDPHEPPYSAANPGQGLKGGVPTSPTGTQRAPRWLLNHCWPLSHLTVSPGALCQQMHRKHLFPTQGQLSQGGPDWKHTAPPTTQDLTPPCPALQHCTPVAPLPITADPLKGARGGADGAQPATALCSGAQKAAAALENCVRSPAASPSPSQARRARRLQQVPWRRNETDLFLTPVPKLENT